MDCTSGALRRPLGAHGAASGLSVVIIAALLAVFVTMTVTGVDLTPLWALLGG